MRIVTMSCVMALAQMFITASALPLITSPSARSNQNRDTRSLKTDAGSLLDRRNSSPGWTKLEARKPTVKLSIYEGSGKYVLLQITSGNAGTTVRKMLMGAIQYVENFEIRFNRDDLLRGGHFEWNLPPVNSLNVWDANNHQATYDIVGLTITTIYNYMSENGFGSATFLIFDGKNQVGAGKIK